MRQFIKKVTTGAMSASLFAFSVVPAVQAATDIVVEGNGAKSHNEVFVDVSSHTIVEQKSDTSVTNFISTVSTTGGNAIKGTTDSGDQNITTGDAVATTTVSVTGGSNVTYVDECGCDHKNAVIDLNNNGAHSHTKVTLKNKIFDVQKQKTNTTVYSVVDTKSGTGKNKITHTTGAGEVSVKTGEAISETLIVVEGGSNGLNP